MIDLHMHTTYSDGTDNLKELLKKAKELKLEIISITDHDNCYVYDELEKLNIKDYYNGKIIKGVELKTTVQGINIEILGYGVDPNVINKKIKKMYISQEEKNQIEFERLYKKCIEVGVKFENDIIKKYDKNKYIYASTYLHKKIVSNNDNKIFIKDEESWKNDLVFYRKYMSDPSGPFFTDVSDLIPKIEDVIDLIREAGGLVFVPHIYIYGINSQKVFDNIMNNYKIDGMECYYSTFTEEQTQYLIDFCKKNNLYISGGSDYHGKTKPDIKLGIGRGNLNIPKEIINNWIDKIL